MKRYITLAAGLLAATLLFGCAPQTPTADTSQAPSGGDTTVAPAPDPTDPEQALYATLFDENSKIELNLRMADTELAKLQADYEKYSAAGSKSPIYRMADLDVKITDADGNTQSYTIEQVGVRMKGNTSRTDFYNAESGVYNLIHLKINFGETFDDEEYYGDDALVWTDDAARKERKNRTFATLEKMDIRWNKCNDATYIREHYAYEMFRANGVLAPRTTLASVDWAGEHCGVFTLYEPVDKIFLQRNLPEAQQGGDLYKLGWTSHGASFTSADSIGVEDEDKGWFFTYDLKTNKKKSDHSALKNLISALNSGDLTKESLADLVDTENFLSFAAVSYLLGNPDDLRNNYNNCYVYFPPQGGCLFIPYDYDRCLGVTHEWDPTGNGVSADDPFTLSQAANGNTQENPLFLRTVCRGGWYTEEYSARLRTLFASDWATNEHFEAVFETAKAIYADSTCPSSVFGNASDHQSTMTTDGSDGNLTVRDYLQAKHAALEKALNAADTPDTPQPGEALKDPVLYIRASYTDWNIDEVQAMTPTADGTYTRIVYGGRIKVYDATSDRWFGAECLTALTEVPWDTDDHTNIVLPEGTYLLIFDPQTTRITVMQAEFSE